MNFTRRSLLASLTIPLPLAALAQDVFPSRPIRIIIPGGAGGLTDGIMRPLAARAGTLLGQQIVIENRPGGGGVIGTVAVQRAPADGYTLLFAANYNMATNVWMVRNLPYDPVKDFAPITRIFTTSFLLVAHPSLNVSSVKELIELVRRNPDQFDFGSVGNGNGSHLAMELFKSMADLRMTHVPYQTPGAMMTDLLAGRVKLAFSFLEVVQQHVQAGKLRALGATSQTRSAQMPDIPTVAEGLPGYYFYSWGGLVAPAGTPRAIIDKINQAFSAAIATPEIHAKLSKDYVAEVATGTPEAFRALIEAEIPRLGDLIKRSGVKFE